MAAIGTVEEIEEDDGRCASVATNGRETSRGRTFGGFGQRKPPTICGVQVAAGPLLLSIPVAEGGYWEKENRLSF